MNLKQIDAKIGELRGIVSNVNERVQEIAVAIIEHAKGAGNGDVSRSITLVQTLPNSFRREYLLQWFKYFGNIGIDLRGGKCRMLDKNNRAYRTVEGSPFDVEGAKANNWFEPFEADGTTRKAWYQGPNPSAFESNTLADFGDNIVKFADRLTRDIDKMRDVPGQGQVPVYALTEQQHKQAEDAIAVLKRLGVSVMAGMEIQNLDEQRKHLEQQAQAGEKLVAAAK